MSQIRTNFLGWRPDQDEFGLEGLITADNIIHDTEGYKPVKMQTAGAFSAATFYSGATLHSVRSMQIRAVGLGNNNMAAIAEDGTGGVADLSIGAQGEAAAFTSISTATLASVGGIRCKAFSVAELESGAFLISAKWDADITGGSTSYALTGEVTYTVGSESSGTSGSGATTSLQGTDSSHTRTNYNATASAGVYLKSDGVEYSYDEAETQEGSTLTAWLDSGTSDGVWARCTVDSGTIEEDAGTGSWLQLNTSRGWAKKQSSFGTGTAIITLETSDISDGSNIIDTATYTLTSIKDGTTLAGTQSQHEQTGSSGTIHAGVHIRNDGVEWAWSDTGAEEGTNLGNWLESGAAGDFWIRCTLNSGTLDGADAGTGSWLACSTSRSWAIEKASGFGQETANITLEIATDASGTNVIDTQSYDLKVNREL